MNTFFKELTKEQRCAVLGFAIDFCGIKEPTRKQFAELEQLLSNIHEELGVSHEDVESYVAKMHSNGRLAFAINTLKTIKNERTYALFYPYFYSIVATLGSREGLAKLNKFYNDDFGYDNEEIKELWDLYEIKDFRSISQESRNNHSTTSSSSNTNSSSGCMILALALSTTMAASLFCIMTLI